MHSEIVQAQDVQVLQAKIDKAFSIHESCTFINSSATIDSEYADGELVRNTYTVFLFFAIRNTSDKTADNQLV